MFFVCPSSWEGPVLCLKHRPPSHFSPPVSGRPATRCSNARKEQLRGPVLRASLRCAAAPCAARTLRPCGSEPPVTQYPVPSTARCTTALRMRCRRSPAHGPRPSPAAPPLPTYTRCVAPKTPRDHDLIDGDGDFAGHGDGGHDASTACLRSRPPHRPTRNPQEQTSRAQGLEGAGRSRGVHAAARVWYRGARRRVSRLIDAVAGQGA